MEWGGEQEQLAEAKVRENSATMMPAEDKGENCVCCTVHECRWQTHCSDDVSHNLLEV